MNDTAETTPTELTDERMDELASASERQGDNAEIPMSAPPEKAAPAQAAPQAPQSYEFKDARGNAFKLTADEILKMREQVSGLPQRLQQMNQERAKWEQERQEFEQKAAPYRQIDDWAAKNPQAWAQIKNQYEQALRGGQPQPGQGAQAQGADPYAHKFQTIEEQLKQIGQFVQGSQAEKLAATRAQEDQALDGEIKSIRQNYPDLDFDTRDAEGKSLEFRIMEHASQNGIKSFKTAFRDFYHDQLVSRAEQAAKTKLSGEVQKKTKLGVLGESPTPRKGLSEPQDIKTKSWNDLEREALDELGIA